MATETHSATGNGLADAVGVEGHDMATAGPGMPQLDFSTWGNQIFWLLVALVVIYFVLSRVALPRIAAVLAERQGTITNDIARAEDLKRQASEAEAAYEQALKDARAEAQAISQRTRDDIKAQVAEATKEADARIAEKSAEADKAVAEIRASAMGNVEAVAKDTAEALVSALGGSADTAAISKAVDNRMKG
ncbi:F0F1 ATP synthase subunit B' [Puniceibacterium sediminis]|uniref:ATP synthase subunit b n=1 Tax=Puniceibacterium sediminis TaxID=1608407 RepID=A0A238Y4A5_9RHOB|nr:F0F1 ATP synthase subunit B' [Puniceibacterium sediminis]SNR65658.1 F-type H+-transporting ATPase subunit b [Puniceibacterium sediminis]